MTTARQTALRRIQKLQALAAKADGHEAVTAARMAQQLMLRHEIEARDVDAAILAASDPMVARVANVGRQLVWLRALYHVVAQTNNCTTAYTPGTSRVTFYGRASDCEIAEYLAVHLSREVQQAADVHLRRVRQHYGRTPKGERNSFCHSAVAALGRRLQAMRREAAQAATQEHGQEAVSTALVRLDDRLAEAKAFAASYNLGTGRRARYRANSAGRAAGERININQGLGGAAAPQIGE